MIVNREGLCLDVDWHNRNNNGANVQVWECNGQPNQQWTLTEVGTLVNGDGLCLDGDFHNRHNNGGNVQGWDCNGHPWQQWRLE